MQGVTISPKYQIVIPLSVQRSMRLTPGQKLQVTMREGRVELFLDRKVTELRGLLKGCNTGFEREEQCV